MAEAAEETPWVVSPVQPLASLPSGAVFLEEEFTKAARVVRLRGVLFSSKRLTLRVVVSTDPQVEDFPGLLKKSGALAGTNGGYFHPDYRPLGLVISGGQELHAEQRASLLSGLLLAGSDGLTLLRAGSKRPSGLREGLQSGPFLIDGGRAVEGLDATKTARRTFLATDGHRQWLLGVLSSCTLAEAGQILNRSRAFGKSSTDRALNLDGGSSTGLWVRDGAEGSEERDFLLRPMGPVSNYLGLYPINAAP